ncbi:LmeA family phospholipid-binding protein [Streptomyces adelaidensis]|uniref:LmeA family phospholipid-binding protein n=1 Tax=Streptomyces adelaidensis TaxID=2796465 RepID=UPI001903B94F|nr:DUF2993 domain-containing protein [Streptomyces adelaidensis]
MHRSQPEYDYVYEYGHDYDYGSNTGTGTGTGTGQAYEPYQPPRRTRRWRRRPLAIAAASAVVLVLAPVAVDRAVAARIESRTAQAFQEGMDTPLPPKVEVHGFPVLAQAASGTLDRVDITAHDIPADGSDRPLPVTELALELEGLTKSDDDSEARARSAEATAQLSYRDMSNALGMEISQGYGADRIRASVLTPLGFEVTATTAVSVASGNRIAFKDFKVAGRVALPDVGEKLLDKAFAQPIELRNIPDGLHLRSVTTTANGLTAHFSGKSVTFHRS